MEMNDNRDQTQDFMSVESFAQLPFIRPSPPVKDKGSGGGGGGGGIRLFGKDFGGNNYGNSTHDQGNCLSEKNGKSSQEGGEESTKYSGGYNNADVRSSNRKFECHYCCRNFPTSQALGGHQNAHKRERQQAKRARLQSVMVHNGLAHHHHNAHVYGLMMNCSTSTPAISIANYRSQNNMISSNGAASYGSYNGSVLQGLCHSAAAHHHQHQPPPINGSPLALWRIPGGNNSSSAVLACEHSMQQQYRSFDSKDESKPFSPKSSSAAHDSQSRTGYLPKHGMKDQMSLDLYL